MHVISCQGSPFRIETALQCIANSESHPMPTTLDATPAHCLLSSSAVAMEHRPRTCLGLRRSPLPGCREIFPHNLLTAAKTWQSCPRAFGGQAPRRKEEDDAAVQHGPRRVHATVSIRLRRALRDASDQRAQVGISAAVAEQRGGYGLSYVRATIVVLPKTDRRPQRLISDRDLLRKPFICRQKPLLCQQIRNRLPY